MSSSVRRSEAPQFLLASSKNPVELRSTGQMRTSVCTCTLLADHCLRGAHVVEAIVDSDDHHVLRRHGFCVARLACRIPTRCRLFRSFRHRYLKVVTRGL